MIVLGYFRYKVMKFFINTGINVIIYLPKREKMPNMIYSQNEYNIEMREKICILQKKYYLCNCKEAIG